jgi:hypothetical protein
MQLYSFTSLTEEYQESLTPPNPQAMKFGALLHLAYQSTKNALLCFKADIAQKGGFH